MDDKPRLFVLVATGQPVANLPPVLELAKPGDQVLWILSRTAQREGWDQGPSRVLERYDLKILKPIQVGHINNPAELSEKLQPVASSWAGKCRPILVANGGNKLTPVGLLRAFEKQKPVVVYNNGRPVQLWMFQHGVFHSPSIRPYQRHQLDLADVLEASGHRIQNPDEAEQLWPRDTLPERLQRANSYGIDPKFTRDLHEVHAQWNSFKPDLTEKPVPYNDVRAFLTEKRIRRWKRSLTGTLNALLVKHLSAEDEEVEETNAEEETIKEEKRREAICKAEKESGKSYILESIVPEQCWQGFYWATAKLVRDAKIKQMRAGMSQPAVGLGATFENAVARRLLEWMDDRNSSPAIQSIWRNVVISHRKEEVVIAELDLLIVLRNGAFIHIECKSFTTQIKDLYARLLNLQHAGSRLAQMVVCVPVFTDFAQESWFRPLHHLSQLIRRTRGLHLLPFTLKNQPLEYKWQTPTGKKSETIPCPRFEDALEKLIRPYEKGG